MPRIHGYTEYRFVEPGWKSPDDYTFETPNLTLEQIETFAQRQDAFARAFEGSAVRCAAHGHPTTETRVEDKATGAIMGLLAPCGVDATSQLRLCELRARLARDCTRTETRTVLVKVHIPVKGKN
jgi:hypothetical protein